MLAGNPQLQDVSGGIGPEGGKDVKGAQGNVVGGKRVLYLDGGGGFLDVHMW